MTKVKSTLIPALTLALALVLGAGAGGRPVADGPSYQLPDGPAADLVSELDLSKVWTRPFRAWPGDLDAPGWDRIEPWVEWAKLVRAEADSEFSKPLRRADLARAAAATGRHEDAWLHFVETKSELSVSAAVLPYLFPGVPLDLPPGAPLASGVTLRPLLPPPIERLPFGSFDPATLLVDQLAIGAARVSFELDLARDGVQIDVTHRSGDSVELALVMTAPSGYATTVEYLDWDRLADVGVARTIRSSPKSDSETETETEHSYWGRFAPRELAWPGISEVESERLLSRLQRIGIRIEAAPSLEARACGLGLALEQLFDIEVREGSELPGRAVAPLVLRLSEESGEEGLRIVMGLAERLAFAH